ncbi:hypothetical protein FOZG_13537 [Fusarium oxysporum Fo47]|uniref:PD-(D/E)XK nuclease-like domain-containing protein n=1 Tax=Fusarium oxysporum Fo47 TaxID=660027 RepID=W9JW17_FUSOX|nr:hypothetical protein FOZG_13537 [Fusarium oxysporum Fo47]
MAAIYEDKEFCWSARRDELGLTPSPEDVVYILGCAGDCLRMGRSEAAWNHEVHFPLLCLALRNRSKGAFQRLVNVKSCSSASIIPDYRIRFAPDKKIDFCVYLDPHHDPNDTNIASTVDAVRAHLPGLSINPTDDLSLLSSPIAIPIETNRPGEGLDTANLQVATFLTAHLTLLQRLLDAGASVPVQDGEKAPSVDDLGFLPSLIVQGNTWNFIAASRQDSRIVSLPLVIVGAMLIVLGDLVRNLTRFNGRHIRYLPNRRIFTITAPMDWYYILAMATTRHAKSCYSCSITRWTSWMKMS